MILKIIFFSNVRDFVYVTDGEMAVHQVIKDIWGQG